MHGLREESEIINQWKGKNVDPLVSICCITYNQEEYIEDALKGFLNQETDFPFEILIHDDASDDRTSNIISEYTYNYPNIIKPIFQKENKYSKGIKINPEYNFSRARGNYIALCEGDDFWDNPKKLKIQIDIMKENPDINLCFHPAEKINEEKKYNSSIIGYIADDIKIIQTKEILKNGITFIPTCSLLIKTSKLKEKKIDDFLSNYGSSYFIKLLASEGSGAIYIPNIMATYRFRAKGSHKTIMSNDIQAKFKLTKQVNHAFDAYNNLTDGRYNKLIIKIQNKRVLNLLQKEELDLEKKKTLYQQYRKQLGLLDKMKYFLHIRERVFLLKILNRLVYLAHGIWKRLKEILVR